MHRDFSVPLGSQEGPRGLPRLWDPKGQEGPLPGCEDTRICRASVGRLGVLGWNDIVMGARRP